MTPENKTVLIVWIVCAFVWDVFLIAGTSYIVFWKGYSGWWFLPAVFIGIQPTLFKKLSEI